ncbi:MAG TPA: PEP/pyruvate-binding domain-containing protein, partial [Thermodesulfobacteriota bacterium]|nr:PEP/pyruvate-binding domain-containing protein [Thermodesulfobacteriota bacterium]
FLDAIGLVPISDAVDQAAQVARLKLNHAEFRKLLSANNSFLETITDLEQKMMDQGFVDRTYVQRRVLRSMVDIHTMVETLNVISNDHYPVLRERLENIGTALRKTVEEPGRATALDPVMDLSRINRRNSDLAGGKVSNLGEIRNVVGLPTPEGFVVTTEGFRKLLDEGGIRSWIQDKDMEIVSTEDVERISQAIQEQIMEVLLPPELAEGILEAYRRLAGSQDHGPALAVRSSALGEDSVFSFAGQFLSLLGISRPELIEAYLKVTASLYSPEAMAYRLLHGIPGQSAEMAVGFITMVDALASGVTFSKDPNHPDSGQILIQAVRGLGVPLVEGRTSPEIFRLSRNLEKNSLIKSLSDQKARLILCGSELREDPINPEETKIPCLTDEEILQLGQWAIDLENHFGGPQDIEWAMDRKRNLVILQSRPLRLIAHTPKNRDPLPGYDILINGGEVACPGVGIGPAIYMEEDDDPSGFPEGGILVARRSSPRHVRLMSKAAAIVTDFGTTTGHMASLAREFRVPALLNTREATRNIPAGVTITVDATNGLVYRGEVPLNREETKSISTENASYWKLVAPELRFLQKVMELISPLNLTDPQAGSFRAEQCQTLHDLARYIHEKSYYEMFMMGDRVGDLRASSYHLDIFLPIDLYLIDLGGGIAGASKKNKVKRDQLTSVPLKALLEGMLHEKIPRYGAKSMDMKGFFSIMMRHASTNPEGERSFLDPCYAMISDNYLNYTARVGYHFSVVDTYCSPSLNKNYISLTFRGGAADLIRRARRARAIAGILRAYGFHVMATNDVVTARQGKSPLEETIELVKMIGSLFQFFRQMDAAMTSEAMVDQYRDAFLRGEYDFGQNVD